MNVEVILLEPYAKLGKAGETVSVKSGYARNYLIPEGVAVVATEANKKVFAARKRALENSLAAQKAEAEKLGEELKDLSVTLHVKAGEGKVYGAVVAADVVDAIKAQTGKELDRRKLVMPKAIKEVGEYNIEYRAHHDVHIPIKVVISAK